MKTYNPKEHNKLLNKPDPEKDEEDTQTDPVEQEEVAPSIDAAAYGEITSEEKAEVEAEVRALVEAELRAQRKKAFKKELLTKYRSLTRPGEKIVPVCLDLPGHANDIRLDGRVFFHGVTYQVTEKVYSTLVDIQARAWEHENEIGGANRDLYRGRKPINPIVSPQGVAQVADQGRMAPMVRF